MSAGIRKPIRAAAYAYGRRNRASKTALVREQAHRLQARSLLLVGVAPDDGGVNNLVERGLLDAVPNVVASGLAPDDGSWPTYVRADGLALPFEDAQFDLVFSNAVIEHVGGEAQQRQFMAEIDRVGRAWMVTTPNRFFPVEAHEHSVLAHWRSSWCPRNGITRLLGIRDFEALLPRGQIRGRPFVSPTLLALHPVQSGPSR
jgi:hypothetical protein